MAILTWPEAADLVALRSATPAYVLRVVVPTKPSDAIRLWSDPLTAKRTNPLIFHVAVDGFVEGADGKRLAFTVHDRLRFCCFSFAVRFAAIFFTPSSSDGEGIMLYSYAPASCGVTVINRWTFAPADQGNSTIVEQHTFVHAPALLRKYVIDTARGAHAEGLQKTAALVHSESGRPGAPPSVTLE